MDWKNYLQEQWSTPHRWLRFNLVGLMGVGIQLATLWMLVERFGLPYPTATLLAVEAAVCHNFLWHVRWTWSDRPVDLPECLVRFLRFNGGTGLISLLGNFTITTLLVSAAGLPLLGANLAAIVSCSLLNFLYTDRKVFHHRGTETRIEQPKKR